MFLWISYAHWLVIISCVLAILWPRTYIRDTIRWHTKPNLVTRFMRWLAPLIWFAAASSADVDPRTSVRIALAWLMPAIVFVAALLYNKQSYRKISIFDIACGISALAALIFWIFVKDPITAVWLAILWDTFAALPTVVKAWQYPETESGTAFLLGLLDVLLVLPSIQVRDMLHAWFQIYLVILNIVLLYAIYRKKILWWAS